VAKIPLFFIPFLIFLPFFLLFFSYPYFTSIYTEKFLPKKTQDAPSPGGSGILFAKNTNQMPKFDAKRYNEQQVKSLKIRLMIRLRIEKRVI